MCITILLTIMILLFARESPLFHNSTIRETPCTALLSRNMMYSAEQSDWGEEEVYTAKRIKICTLLLCSLNFVPPIKFHERICGIEGAQI
jgi:hypothetical protein